LNLEIEGHVAIVTGGARGLGAEICLALAEEGVHVVVWDRDAEAEAHAARIRDKGGSASCVVANVADSGAVNEAAAAVMRERGRIEILVNCAGFSRDSPIGEMTDQQWHDVIGVNLHGTFFVCRAVVPAMQGQQYGRIVNISSRARTGDNFKVNYSAAKEGVVGLTMALALELGKSGITVNAVAPGFCETERTRGLPYFKDLKSRALEKTPTNRLGNERDIADSVLYLAGRRSGFISGEVLTVAGGRWR
jgi:3-oxoacyl-[acyl-carrier protein] reductase